MHSQYLRNAKDELLQNLAARKELSEDYEHLREIVVFSWVSEIRRFGFFRVEFKLFFLFFNYNAFFSSNI